MATQEHQCVDDEPASMVCRRLRRACGALRTPAPLGARRHGLVRPLPHDPSVRPRSGELSPLCRTATS